MGEQRNCARRPLKQHLRIAGPFALAVCGCDHHGRLTDNLVEVTCKLCIKRVYNPKRLKHDTPRSRLRRAVELLLEERRSHEENHHS